MPSRNPVTVTGNLVSDPEPFELREGASGVRLTVAESIGYRDRSGDYVEEDSAFWPITVWGHGTSRLPANIVASLHKGDRVTVTGRYRNNVWEDEDGKRRSRLELQADEVAVSLRHAEAKVSRNASGSRTAPPAPAGVEPF